MDETIDQAAFKFSSLASCVRGFESDLKWNVAMSELNERQQLVGLRSIRMRECRRDEAQILMNAVRLNLVGGDPAQSRR